MSLYDCVAVGVMSAYMKLICVFQELM